MDPEAAWSQRRPKHCKIIITAASLATAGLLFAALGVWQVERRSEKLGLIAAVEQRLRAPPAAAPGPAQWPHVSAAAAAYRPVGVSGVFLHDRETLVQAATARGAGYWVMTPLRTGAGWIVLVNRGFVPPEARERAARRAGEPAGPVAVAGLLRISEPGGGFLHANDPAQDRWYSRDVTAIGRARGLGGPLAPYFIDAGAGGGGPGQPVGGMTVVSFPNNHLEYALTWFALMGLCGVGVVRVWRGRGQQEEGGFPPARE